MATNDRAANDGHDRAAKPRARFFAVRLWTEEVAGGWEYRGNVQDIVSRAFQNFRDWSDLTAFMIARMEDDERPQAGRTEGGTPWPLEEQR
jgi:hypothetical protein